MADAIIQSCASEYARRGKHLPVLPVLPTNYEHYPNSPFSPFSPLFTNTIPTPRSPRSPRSPHYLQTPPMLRHPISRYRHVRHKASTSVTNNRVEMGTLSSSRSTLTPIQPIFAIFRVTPSATIFIHRMPFGWIDHVRYLKLRYTDFLIRILVASYLLCGCPRYVTPVVRH